MYNILDVNTNIDLKSGEFIDETRATLSSNYRGDGYDRGHLVQEIFGTEKLGLARITQGAGIAISPPGIWLLHPNAVEIEYLIAGEGCLDYPDGTKKLEGPRGVSITQPGAPHRMAPTKPIDMD